MRSPSPPTIFTSKDSRCFGRLRFKDSRLRPNKYESYKGSLDYDGKRTFTVKRRRKSGRIPRNCSGRDSRKIFDLYWTFTRGYSSPLYFVDQDFGCVEVYFRLLTGVDPSCLHGGGDGGGPSVTRLHGQSLTSFGKP